MMIVANIFKKTLCNFEEYVTLFFFSIMCIFVLLQIITRYILNDPLGYSDEIARYAYVWMTFIGLALATKHDLHVRVELIQMLVKGPAYDIIKLLIDTGVLIILCIILYLSYEYTIFSSVNRWASLPQYSMLLVNISLPIGCLIAVLRLAGIIYKSIVAFRAREMRQWS
jgi:TRAP-type C4-dicarboxylate transport system permease small subunit